LQLDFPGHQSDVSGSTKILKEIDIHVGKLGDALGVTERNQQSQLGPVLPPGSVFDVAAAIGAVRIDLAVVSQKPVCRFRDGPSYPSRAVGVVTRRAFNPALLIDCVNERDEPPIGELTAPRSEGLADPPPVMEAVDVKRTMAFVGSDFSAARPEKPAACEVTPEGV
jgi:hypothetical protein